MKRRKKKENLGKKLMSSILAMTMAAELVPGMALAVNAEVNENLVTSLAEVYDGDEARAREELQVLYESGIIDENGNMVALDIQEDGNPVELEDVASRIANGETVGDTTVNGHAATHEQLLKISQLKSTLELVQMLSEDVEITDEHVENLESLIEGIADGSVDINSAIESGSLSVNNQKSAPKMKATSFNALNAPLAGANEQASDFPETKTGDGEVTADDEGNYTQPLISGSDYDANYNFQLSEPQNTTYYTDSRYEGIITDGVISLSCEDTATADSTFTVTATLDKAQSVPVTFDWEASGVTLDSTQSGTVTFAVGETSKTFTVNVGAKNENWIGDRTLLVRVGNVRNANLENDSFIWNKVIKVSATDTDAVLADYVWKNVGTINEGDSDVISKDETYSYYNGSKSSKATFIRSLYLYKTVDWIPKTSPIKFTLGFSGALPSSLGDYKCSLVANVRLFNASSNLPDSPGVQFQYWKDIANSKRGSCTVSAGDTSAVGEITADPSTLDSVICNSQTVLVGFVNYSCICDFSIDLGAKVFLNEMERVNVPKVSSVSVDVKVPQRNVQVTDVSVPAGTYYSGQTVPVTVTLNHYVIANSNTKLTVNGTECSLIDGVDIQSNKLTFGYTVKPVDTGSISATALSNLATGTNIEGNFPNNVFGIDEGVKLVSAVKQESLDLANVKYGISDAGACEQEMTVIIPFKSDANVNWVGNESGECTTNGKGISMKLPDYGNVTLKDYLNGAYFSYDNGKTRYPVYVVRSNDGYETPVALACRFAPPLNETAYLRKDTLNLFMDMYTVGISDSTKYLDTWENKKTDTKGFAYFDGSGKTDSAPVAVGTNYTYYTKGGVMFEPEEFISQVVRN